MKNLHLTKKIPDEIGPKHLTFLDMEINMPSDLECVYTSIVYLKIIDTHVLRNYFAISSWIFKICLIECFF